MMEGESKRILEGTQKFFKNLQENLNLFSLFYKNCFQDSLDEVLLENTKQLVVSFGEQLGAFLKNF